MVLQQLVRDAFESFVGPSQCTFIRQRCTYDFSRLTGSTSNVLIKHTKMATADAEVVDCNYRFLKNYTFPVKDIPHLSINDEEAVRKIDANV